MASTKLTVGDVKNAHGGIFSFNGFLYLCSYNGKVHEIASMGDKGWIYYDQPKESHIDNECEVVVLMINAKILELINAKMREQSGEEIE